jgi:hypothetical protein
VRDRAAPPATPTPPPAPHDVGLTQFVTLAPTHRQRLQTHTPARATAVTTQRAATTIHRTLLGNTSIPSKYQGFSRHIFTPPKKTSPVSTTPIHLTSSDPLCNPLDNRPAKL